MREVPGARDPDLIRAAALLALLGGCDAVFGLDRSEPSPASCEDVTPDEDGDCIADSIDNCPGFANDAQLEELDVDGVGDVCDPNARTAGDRIAEFHGFADPAAAMLAWHDLETQNPTQWVFEPGRVVHASTTDAFSVLLRTMEVDAAEITVEAAFVFHGWGGDPASGPRISVLIDTVAENGHSCWLNPQTDHTNVDLQEAGNGSDTRSSLPVLKDGDLVTIRLTRSNEGVLRCRASLNTANPVDVPQVSRTKAWPTVRQIAIHANKAAYDLAWVTIYARD